jgi:hypothetical protein
MQIIAGVILLAACVQLSHFIGTTGEKQSLNKKSEWKNEQENETCVTVRIQYMRSVVLREKKQTSFDEEQTDFDQQGFFPREEQLQEKMYCKSILGSLFSLLLKSFS